ncbi:hypothetical protein N8A98_22230 [Devosia neptuniae]|uniref:Uncharacterized protein n=1 Tax=Devosia neptuniae TaxID=191302 RepID=A0ABY6CFB3_9HYPH|nr:hypothetical protein [Devosia neptuniae]UXN69891.1 hypothetical protein N8A98_22230 [Devosia neptuniae]
MRTYMTMLGKRDPNNLELTKEEAADLMAAGFRFAEYSEEGGKFRLSAPYRIAQNLDRGTLTIMQ